MRFAVGLTLLMLLFAGCVSNSTTSPPSSTTIGSQSTSMTGTVEIPLPLLENRTEVPVDIFFSKCRDALTAFTFPLSTAPGSHPPGWEPTFQMGSNVGLRMIECDRISWGPIERPIHLLFEIHEHLNPQGNCTTLDGVAATGSLAMLNSLWIDSEAAANYLKAVYDLPVLYANFNVSTTRQANGETESQTWTWNQPGQPSSQVSYYGIHWQTIADPLTDRMFWFNSTMLSYINLNMLVTRGQQLPLSATPGTMRPPMLYATAMNTETYVGHGELQELELSGHIKRYSDYQCRTPLP
ncbi:MAG: hypothetical protein LC623_02405 [Halobacteriales archaeon]|nr:hypothetical protein [Halobacteriales archaeon]